MAGPLSRLLRATPAQTGEAKERLARSYLEHHGLTHLAHNVRCRHGEIDLVMRDADTLVFVEVRYRRSERFGGARASIRMGLCSLSRHSWRSSARNSVRAGGCQLHHRL